MKIAYLVDRFPALSQTWIINEVQRLRARGDDVCVYSLHKPNIKYLTPEYAALEATTTYVDFSSISRLIQLRSTVYWASRAPSRAFAARSAVRARQDRPLRWKLNVCRPLARAFAEAGIEHIHTHFAAAASEWTYLISLVSGIPYTITPHAYDIFIQPRLLCAKLAGASSVIAVSAFHKRFFQEACNGSRLPPIHVVHYGIDCERFAPSGDRRSRRNERICFVGVGRLVEKKGFHFLIEACREMRQQNIDFECVIAGAGLLEQELRSAIATHGLEDYVRLLGAMTHDEVRELMKNADVFVLPCCRAPNGDMDGIPNVLMEAMALGVPVVTSRLSGIPELVDDSCGRLVTPCDVPGLADALIELALLSSEDRHELGRHGREIVIERFNVQHQSQKLRTVFGAGGVAWPANPNRLG